MLIFAYNYSEGKNNTMSYREEKSVTKQDKAVYLNGINETIQKIKAEAAEKRKKYFSEFFNDTERYRKDLKAIFGWPINSDFDFNVEKESEELLFAGAAYKIYRLKLRVMEDLILSGLFFKKGDSKKPLIFLQNGFQGTPELMSGFYGDTANYNDILQTLAEFDADIFSPQLLLWDGAAYGVEFSRPDIDNELKRVGSSITAVEIFAYIKVMDFFEKAYDIKSFGMIGLSYGGFYTLVVSALDARIRSAYSCSFYHNMDMLHQRSDWVWNKAGEMFSSAEIAALIYPRRLCVAMGDKDELFGTAFDTEVERLRCIFKDGDLSWFKSVKFSGGHEFYVDKAIIEILVKDLSQSEK